MQGGPHAEICPFAIQSLGTCDASLPQSMPIQIMALIRNASQCQSLSINADQFRSMPIKADQYRIKASVKH